MHTHLGNRSNCIASRSLSRDRRRRAGPEAVLNTCLPFSLAGPPDIGPKKDRKQVPVHRSSWAACPQCPGRAPCPATPSRPRFAGIRGPGRRGLAASRIPGGSLFRRTIYGILCCGSGQDSRLGVGGAHQKTRFHGSSDTGMPLASEATRPRPASCPAVKTLLAQGTGRVLYA